MAKFKTIGLIHSIRGKLGDIVFSSWKGVLVVKTRTKNRRDPKSKRQLQVRKVFSLLTHKWQELSMPEKALWEEYVKKYKYKKKVARSSGPIRTANRGTMMGINAFFGVNQMLISSGFPPIKIPTLGTIPKPLPPCTDLTPYTLSANGKIEFNIWLSNTYPTPVTAQIWIRRIKHKHYSYIAKIVPLSTTPQLVVLEKIRTHYKNKIVDLPFKKLEKCELLLQMRTVAQNGEFSIPSAIYKLEVKNTH